MKQSPLVFGLLFIVSIAALGALSIYQGGLVPPRKVSSVQVLYFGRDG